MNNTGVRPGSAQRRQRQQMHRRGWRSITTFVRADHHDALKQIQKRHNFGTLHEALEFALTRSVVEHDFTIKPANSGLADHAVDESAACTSDLRHAKTE